MAGSRARQPGSLPDRTARRPTTEGAVDARTVPQRLADALIELCEHARATDELPTTAGELPHVTVTIDWDALRTALGTATLTYGQLLKCTNKGGTSPSTADESSSNHPRSSTRTVGPAPTHSAADHCKLTMRHHHRAWSPPGLASRCRTTCPAAAVAACGQRHGITAPIHCVVPRV